MEYVREHPIRILSRISHFIVLLIVPALRALLFSGANFQQWIAGAWIDLTVLLIMIGCGFMAWFFDNYHFGEEGVDRFTGIFWIRRMWYPIQASTMIAVEQPWYLSMFGAARLRLDTTAGKAKKSDLNLVVSVKTAQSFFDNRFRRVRFQEKVQGSFSSIFGLSVFSSSGFTGMIFFVTLISQSGQIFGHEFERQIVNNVTKTMQFFAFGIPPAAAIVSGMIIIGWLISFVMNLLRYSNFLAQRSGNLLRIRNGVWADRHFYDLAADKISFLMITQTLVAKVMGLYAAYVGAIGYGKRKNERQVLIPIARRKSMEQSLANLFPEFSFCKKQIQPKAKFFMRFLWVPLFAALAIVALSVVLCAEFSAFEGLIWFVAAMLLIADGIAIVMRVFSFFHTGAAFKSGIFSVYYTKGLKICSVCFQKEKLVAAQIQQTVFQKRADCCTMVFYTYGEKKRRHVVLNVELADAQYLLHRALI